MYKNKKWAKRYDARNRKKAGRKREMADIVLISCLKRKRKSLF